MADDRTFLQKPLGKGIAVLAVIVGLIAVVYSVYSNLGSSEAALNSRERWFICSETGKLFRHELTMGEKTPVLSPFSNKNTGFEPEQCFWTKAGKPKTEPTYVLLNSRKGGKEPTFCPDCGRLVVPLNPAAGETLSPPPTEAEYQSRHNAGPNAR